MDNKSLLLFSSKFAKQKEYWINRLAGEIEETGLLIENRTSYRLLNRKEKTIIDFSSAGNGLYERLMKLGKNSDISIFIILLAALNVLIYRWTGNEDIIVKIPVYKPRMNEQTINDCLFIRNVLHSEKTFKEVILDTRKAVLEAHSNQDYPADKIIEYLKDVSRKSDNHSLSDILCALDGLHDPGQIDELLAKSSIAFLFAGEEDGGISHVCYDAGIYEAHYANLAASHFTRLLASGVENVNLKIMNFSLLSVQEKEQILVTFNDTASEYQGDKTVAQLFQDQAAENRSSEAIIEVDSGHSVSYGELNTRANQLARLLRDKGLRTDGVAAVKAEHSIEALIAILGILKVGGAYLAVDPDYPEMRQKYLLEDCSVNILLLQGKYSDNKSVSDANLEVINLGFEDLYKGAAKDPEAAAGPGNPAYVIYTSGSTGIPKGVMVENRAIVRLVKNTNYIDFSKDTRILQTGAMEFDASTFEMWGALLNGGKLYLIKKNDMLMPGVLKKVIETYKINLMWMASGLFNKMFDLDVEIFKGLENILIGGDVLSPPRINKLRREYPALNVINGFGPTENTTFSTCFLIDADYETNIPIGKPISNSTVYILDKNYRLLPVGAAGQLCLGGDGLARGYLNNPELTAEKFIPAPEEIRNDKCCGWSNIVEENESRIYLSGDIARWLPDGNVEFLERLDRQVKIRGFRVELTGIENRLLEIDFINEAVVTAFTRGEAPAEVGDVGEKYLCVYYTADREIEASELRGILSSILPDYMVPTYFIQMSGIPLTPNGKVDRKALPEPVLREAGVMTAPRDKIEAELITLWAEVLHIDEKSFGIDGNFFELGGHSLSTINLAAKIRKKFNIELKIIEIFQLQTVRELAAELKKRTINRHLDIEAVEKKEYYPLSSAQERLYFLQKMDFADTAYNNPMLYVIAVSCKKNVEVILHELVNRHESLRTSFILVGGDPMQKIHEELEFEVDYYETGGDKNKLKEITRNFVKPFDLNRLPLFRVSLINTSREQNVLLIDVHHIVTDGISLNIILKDFAILSQGKELSTSRLQYKDYSCWQNGPERKRILNKQGAYWLKKFAGDIPLLNLPTDSPRLGNRSFAGGNITFEIENEQLESLTALTKSREVTLYMALLAAYNILLSKLCDQEDIIVGTPVGGRSNADLENIAGMLVNTVVMRNNVDSRCTVLNFLEKIKINTIEAFDNQDYQFEDIVRELNLERDISRNPLFDVMFFLQTQYEKIDTAGWGPGMSSDLDLYAGINTKFDMTLTGIEGKEGLFFFFEYRLELFKEETIKRFADYFKKIVNEITRCPGQKIAGIDILSTEEREAVLYEFNSTKVEYPRNILIQQIFMYQVERVPDATAVVSGENFLSYCYLDERSNLTARLLRGKGCAVGEIVGLLMPRTEESVGGLLGILKANALCLPLSLKYPGQWITEALLDSGAGFLIRQETGDKDPNILFDGITVYLDSYKGNIPEKMGNPLETKVEGTAAQGFIIYTSGSAGKPKGTILSHSGINNHTFTKIKELTIGSGDILCQNLNSTFVASIWQFLAPLYTGARFHIYPEEVIVNPYELFKKASGDYISVLEVVPSVLSAYLDLLDGGKEKIEFPQLRLLALTGEKVRPELVRRFYNLYFLELVNAYGQSECSDDTLHYHIPHDRDTIVVPIGKPANNTSVYVLNRDNQLQPMGVRGELYIGGAGLAQGYLNRPGLTAEKFMINPFCPGEKMFRTGDIVRWLPDGIVDYIGRSDHQLKLRGFRVEPGEIESVLTEHPGIKEAVVIAKEDNGGEKYLCAYISGEDIDNEFPGNELLREYVSHRLPDYMVPSYFVRLDKIPLTANGKIDKKALPDPILEFGRDFTAPRNEIERELVRIWSEVLRIGQDKIGIDTNFFDFGGHSLRAINVIEKIHKKLHVRVPLDKIFTLHTVRGLAKYIETAVAEEYTLIYPIEKREFYALSSAQRRLYFLHRLDPGSTVYNNLLIQSFNWSMSKVEWEEIFRKLIKGNEILRTSYELVNEEPVQRVHDCNAVSFVLEYYAAGLEGTGSGNREAVGIEEIVGSFIRPFNLAYAPLLRVGVIKVTELQHILLLDIHHIAADGTSMNLIVKNLITLIAGREPSPLKVQYKDYALWQNCEKRAKLLKKQEKYWQRQFDVELPVLELPNDYPRPIMQSFEGDKVAFEIGVRQAEAIKEAAVLQDATLYMILLAIYNILLAKLSGQEDIIVGSPVAGRRHVDLENIIGMFVNSIPLRNQPYTEKRFNEFLGELRENTLEAFDNQEYPFEELVEKIKVTRDTGRNPLFDVMFILQNQDGNSVLPGSIAANTNRDVTPSGNINPVSRFDMTLSGIEIDGRLLFVIEYCTKLFKRETIEYFIRYFKNILSFILEAPATPLKDIEFMDEEEKKRILDIYNKTAMAFPRDKAIHELFEEQTIRTPNQTALVYEDSQLSFEQLDEKINCLAGTLRSKGVGQDVAVGIMVERSLEMLIGIFGILKSGGAYLPIEPYYPEERKNYILRDSNARVLLTDSDAFLEFEKLRLSEIAPIFLEEMDIMEKKINIGKSPVSLAYIIYTSGSTGSPKGVMIGQKAILNTLFALNKRYPFSDCDAYLLKTSYMFDVSVAELFGWVFNEAGGKLVIMGKNGEKDPLKIINAIEKHFITHINFVPSMFNTLMDSLIGGSPGKLSSLKYIFIAGEAFLPESADKFNQYFYFTPDLGDTSPGQDIIKKGKIINYECKLENIYGPTETAIYASWYSLKEWQGGRSVPIGMPLHNVELYVLDKNASLLPFGVTGELYIAGNGLARGYINNPELTAEKFVKAFNRKDSDRLYRTGDLARRLPDGNVGFLGRIDSQVKIRGFRIELGEIENRLLNHKKISKVVVTTKEGKQGEKYLCAYIKVIESYEMPSVTELREYLSGSLPDYMIPLYFIPINRIPLTPGGKIDRKALPDPIVKRGTGYQEPQNEIERKLVEIWSQVLNIDKKLIGINCDFFDLGGHSLKAVVMIAKIQKEFNVKLPLEKIFKLRDIFRLSKYIEGLSRSHKYIYNAIEQVEKREYYYLSSAQERMYILQHKNKGGIGFNLPTIYLIEAEVDRKKLDAAFAKLISRHEILRTSYEMINNSPIQRIHEQMNFACDYFRVEDREGAEKIVSNYVKPFDFSKAPLIRAALIKLAGEKNILLVDIHHINIDFVSMDIAVSDLVNLYNERELPVLSLQYKDFALWQNGLMKSGKIKEQEEYWLQKFAKKPPLLNIPTDYPRPAFQSFEGARMQFIVDQKEIWELKKYGESQGATLYIVLSAVLNILLSKLSGQEDIVIGSPTAGRRDANVQGLIGMFVNTLALRNYPEKEKTFKNFLEEVKKNALDAFENQDFQIEELISKIEWDRDISRNVLFDVVLNVLDLERGDVKTSGLGVEPYDLDLKIARFDLYFHFQKGGDILSLTVEYSTKLFKKQTIELYIKYFKDIISTILENPGKKIMEIEIMDERIKDNVLLDFNVELENE